MLYRDGHLFMATWDLDDERFTKPPIQFASFRFDLGSVEVWRTIDPQDFERGVWLYQLSFARGNVATFW
jgi:hypothetical protein